MDELDAGGKVDVPLAGIAAEPGGAESQHRPEALAAGRDNVCGKLGNEHHRALHVVENDAVDGAQILRDQTVKPIQRGAARRLAPCGGPPFERNDRFCHRPSRLTARARKGIHAQRRRLYTSPEFSPMSQPASRPGVRSARSGPKSVAGATVEARDAAGGRLGATRRATLSGRQRASRHLPDAPHRAARRSYSVGRTASRRL